MSKVPFFYHCTLFPNYCNFLSICQNSIILVRLGRFQGVLCKFEKKKKRFKNKKDEDKKVKILHFYWSENLNLWQYQLSKHFSKAFCVLGDSL